MMGDGMGAMALMIFAVMALILVGGFVTFLFVTQRIAKAAGATSRRSWVVGLLAGAVGLGAGTLLVIAIFYENVWSPPPTVQFVAASGTVPRWVILLEDPARGQQLRWEGREAPFMGISTTVKVPAGGVVRVRDLHPLDRGSAEVVWPDGRPAIEYAVGGAPRGLGAKTYAAWGRQQGEGVTDDLPLDDEELATWIRSRESMGN